MGRACPSRGRRDWVSDNESGGGGGGGAGVNAGRAFEGGGIKGPSSSSEEEGDGDLSCVGWCANQPRLCSESACEDPRREGEVAGYKEPGSTSSRRRYGSSLSKGISLRVSAILVSPVVSSLLLRWGSPPSSRSEWLSLRRCPEPCWDPSSVAKEKKRGWSGEEGAPRPGLLWRLRNCDAYVANDDVMKEGK